MTKIKFLLRNRTKMHFEKESFRSVHYIIWHRKRISWKILHNERKNLERRL